MKKTNLKTSLILIVSLSGSLLTGCGMSGMGANQAVGSIGGAVAGGAVGHQFGKGSGNTAMTIIGTMLGGYLGGMAGQRMDQVNYQNVSYGLSNAPNYQPTQWTNPNTNTEYSMTPIKTYQRTFQGRQTDCRDYMIDAYIDGRQERVKGRACRDATGNWQIAG